MQDETQIDGYVQKSEPFLITVEEACKLTNIGRNTMLKFVKMKGFPAIILPHKILIDKSMLPVWISKNYGYYKI